MKRRGFLGLLTGLPFVTKVEPKLPPLPWSNKGVPISPSIKFSNDTDTGIYRSGADLVVVVGGRDIRKVSI